MKKQKMPSRRKVPHAPLEESFAEVVSLIQQAQQRAFQAVNTEIIDLYWQNEERKKVGRNKRSVSGIDEHAGNGLRPYPGLRLRKRHVFSLK